MQYKHSILIASSLLALSACSSSSKDSEPGTPSSSRISNHLESVGSLDNTARIGWLLAFDDTKEQDVSIYSTFFEIDAQNPQNNPVIELLSEGSDTCVVEVFSLETPLLEDQLLNDFTSVSAGEVITLSSSAGSYGEMGRFALQNGIGYVSLDAHPYPSPDSLIVSVPGDDFSATSITIDKPPVVEGLNFVESQVVPAGSAIQWTASESNDTLVSITLDNENNGDVSVSCVLVDDGEFIVPDTVFAEANTIAGGDVQLEFDSVYRHRAEGYACG